MNQEVVSFVLRFVREGGDDHPARWRGVIKHVQSDHSADFAHFQDALQFMQEHVDEAIRQAFSSGDKLLTPESMLAETTRLWGEMAPRYTDIMLESMQFMLEQGRRMGSVFAENMTLWQHARPNQQAHMHEVIAQLTAQVETLNAKIEELETRLHDE